MEWDRFLEVFGRGPEPKSEHPVVLFHTPWERAYDGWSVAARLHARAMAAGGLDVRLVNWKRDLGMEGGEVDAEALAEVKELTARPGRWDLHLFSAMVAGAWQMKDVFKTLREQPGPQAFHCVFERNYLEPDLVEGLNTLDGVWAQCRGNYRVLVEHGVENATWIPFPFFEDDPHLQVNAPLGSNRFYWIGREEPRKDPGRLVRAFLRAFKPGEAHLALKLSPISSVTAYTSVESVIEREMTEPDVLKNGWRKHPVNSGAIAIMRGLFSKAEMVRLHAQNDVYVVPSRGEGLELGSYAAKLAGRRLVATACGGPEDFIDPESDILVPATKLVPAAEEYDWGDDATYIDYDLDVFVAALQKARAMPPGGSRRWPLMEQHRAPAVGKAMREWVEGMCGR